MSRLKLSVGCRVRYDGDIWEVVGLEGPAARLRALTGGLTLVATRELVGAEDFEVLDGVPEGERTTINADEIEGLSKAAKKQALERLAHLREAETGYRSGNPEEPASREPKPEFDPHLVSPHRAHEDEGAGAWCLSRHYLQLETQLRGRWPRRPPGRKDDAAPHDF